MSNKTQELKRAMQDWWIKAEKARWIYGVVGRTNADGTVTITSDRQDFIWITLDTGTLAIAYNKGSGAVDLRAGLPVKVRADSGRLIVDGENLNGFSSGDNNAPRGVSSVNDIAPDSHGNVTLDTDDINEGSINFYYTDARVGSSIHGATAKNPPVDADEVPIIDSAASNVLKKVTWANIKAAIKTYYDSLATTLTNKTLDSTNISSLTAKNPPVDADSAVIVDSAASNVFKRVTYTNIKAFLKTYFDTLYLALAGGTMAGNIDMGTNLIRNMSNPISAQDAATKTYVDGFSYVHAATSKATPVGADELGIIDSAASNVLKKLTFTNLNTYLATLYFVLAGQAGGQTAKGGTASGENLTLMSTANATKGKILFGASAYDEVNERWGFGTNAPSFLVHAKLNSNAAIRAAVENTNTSTAAQALFDARNDAGHSFQAGATGSGFTPSGLIGADTIYFQANGSPLVVRTIGANDMVFGINSSTEALRLSGSSSYAGFGGITSPAAQVDILQSTLGSPAMQIASTASGDDPTEIGPIQNKVTTTNNTVTTLHTFTIPASTTYAIVGYVVARRTGGSAGTAEDGALYKIEIAFKNVAGTATILTGTTGVTPLNEDQAGWDCTLSPSGATVRVRVLGATSNNVSWVGTFRVYPISS